MLIPALKPHTQLLLISSFFVCFSSWHSVASFGSHVMGSPSTAAEMLEQGVIWLNEAEVRAEIGYPEIARRSGITGHVKMDVLVNESGIIKNLQVTHSDHPLLEVACIEKLVLSRFSSAIKDGAPIAAWTSLQFSFQ